jgi:hypothetical protein
VRAWIKVAVADVVLIIFLLWVLGDMQGRLSYATAEGRPATFVHSIFIQFFQMSTSSLLLQSPPTLDWSEILVFVLVVINAYFAYSAFRDRSSKIEPASAPTGQSSSK